MSDSTTRVSADFQAVFESSSDSQTDAYIAALQYEFDRAKRDLAMQFPAVRLVEEEGDA